MPCYTVNKAKVKLSSKEIDAKLLASAMEDIGILSYQLNKDGTVTTWGEIAGPELSAKINRAYSARVFRSQAERFKWAIKETGNGEFEVMKGGAMAAKF